MQLERSCLLLRRNSDAMLYAKLKLVTPLCKGNLFKGTWVSSHPPGCAPFTRRRRLTASSTKLVQRDLSRPEHWREALLQYRYICSAGSDSAAPEQSCCLSCCLLILCTTPPMEARMLLSKVSW